MPRWKDNKKTGKRGIDKCWDCRQLITSGQGGLHLWEIYNKQPMLYDYLPIRKNRSQMVYICSTCHNNRMKDQESK